jgi:hypothetical protein
MNFELTMNFELKFGFTVVESIKHAKGFLLEKRAQIQKAHARARDTCRDITLGAPHTKMIF